MYTYYAGILNHPMAINISANEETKMNCTVIGDHINWKINGTPLAGDKHAGFYYSHQSSVLLDETTNIRTGQLRIRGLNTTNGTMVTCVASQVIDSEHFTVAESEPALILVQGTVKALILLLIFPRVKLIIIIICYAGTPDVVTNLTISTSNFTATAVISWNRPANLLNGINIDYQIEVATCSYTYIANYSNTTLHHTLPHRNVSHSVIVKAVTNAGDGKAKTHTVNLPNFVINLFTEGKII